jgi:glycine betaine/proline transport system permease protein
MDASAPTVGGLALPAKDPTSYWRHSSIASWLVVVTFAIACILLRERAEWLVKYPAAAKLPVSGWFNAAMNMVVANTEPLFKFISMMLAYPMAWIRGVLHWLPWSGVVLGFACLAWRARGWPLALFSTLAMLYILSTGLWPQAMNSLALVLLSVPLAVLLGFGLGVLCLSSRRAERVVMPILDLAQTVPAFAYLLPILLLFGFGSVVGLISSILFAFPPMVRNTIVGMRGVPAELEEAGRMSGATPWQLFWQVRYPTALPQLQVGINQTTMAALSMVIIASIIGGTNDIGWQVLSTMRKAEFGASLIAGMVIALLAMMLDRITAGLAEREASDLWQQRWFRRHSLALWVAGLTVASLTASHFLPALRVWPEAWTLQFAAPLDEAVMWFVRSFKPTLEAFKNAGLFFFMLPIKVGLEQAVSPFSWGFAPTAWHLALYCLLVAGGAVTAAASQREDLAAAIAVAGVVVLVGVTRMPWPAMIAIIVYFGFRLGGARLAGMAAAVLVFLLVTGNWDKAMLSLYLCSIAVVLSFVIGTGLGILAFEHEAFSRFMRPINDTLQTMPQFVLLIPVVMIFAIGEFTALLAIISYAYVPAFRYTENGLRNVDGNAVEAATSLGATRLQKLFLVRLPLALPNIMLGLNQTIMYGIGMLVITALVGTSDLGQEVYIGLSAGNFGQGFVAGLGIAGIAMLADHYCAAWQANHRNHLTGGRP